MGISDVIKNSANAVGRGFVAAGKATGNGLVAVGKGAWGVTKATGRGFVAAGKATGNGLVAVGKGAWGVTKATGRGFVAAGKATGNGLVAAGKGLVNTAKTTFTKENAEKAAGKAVKGLMGGGVIEDITNQDEKKKGKGVFKMLFVGAAIILGAVFLGPLITPILTGFGMGAGMAGIAGYGLAIGGAAYAAQSTSRGIGMSSEERSKSRMHEGENLIKSTDKQLEKKITGLKEEKSLYQKVGAAVSVIGLLAASAFPLALPLALLIGVVCWKKSSTLDKKATNIQEFIDRRSECKTKEEKMNLLKELGFVKEHDLNPPTKENVKSQNASIKQEEKVENKSVKPLSEYSLSEDSMKKLDAAVKKLQDKTELKAVKNKQRTRSMANEI